MRTRSFLRTTLMVCALGSAAIVLAQEVRRIDIPAGDLRLALETLAKQYHVEFVYQPEDLRGLRTQGVSGELSPRDAVSKLLSGTPLEVRTDVSGALLITPRRGAKPEPDSSRDAAAPAYDPASYSRSIQGPSATAESGAESRFTEAELGEVIVTARKRAESLAQVPGSITVFTAETLRDLNIQSFNDYATKTPNLAFTYGGGPPGVADARTISIRGVAGQNLSGTGGTTGFYIDDTPVPVSLDPRVVDIDDIEILKGPQGTLFGEGSLGGNVRLITKRPDTTATDAGYMAQAGLTSGGGSADRGGNLIGNIVLVPDRIAARTVLFANYDAGYLTRTYPDPESPGDTNSLIPVGRQSVGNQGSNTAYGGSASLLFRVTEKFEVKLRAMYQDQPYHGFPAAFAPLPRFTPVYTLDRAFDVQPKASDSWTLPSLDLKYSGAGWSTVWSTSYFYRHTRDLEDSTYGTEQALTGYYGVCCLPAQPYLWNGEHYFNQVSSEARISFDPIHDFSGTFGLFYSRARTKYEIPPTYASGLVAATAANTVVGPWPNDELWQQSNPGTQEDDAVFGELYYKLSNRWTLTLGAREYRLHQTADYNAGGFLNFGTTPSDPQSNTETGLNPKYALSYQANGDVMVYGSASKGFRAGGAQAALAYCALPTLPLQDITHIQPDTLWSYEVGAKVQVPDPGLLLSVAGYDIDWRNIQQQVGLPCGAYFAINGGRARLKGGEFEASGRLLPGLQIRAGIGYEDTSITEPGALGIVGVPVDSRISGVPAWTVALAGVYTHNLTTDMQGFLSANYSYTGNSISLLNSAAGSQATRPSYSLVNARLGVSWARTELSLNVQNATNAKPNLGDIGYVGYAQFNSAGEVIPQVMTLPPLTVLVQLQKGF